LFGDLELGWEAEKRRELDAEVADRTRAELAATDLAGRLAAAAGAAPVDLVLRCGLRLQGPVVDVGRDWLLVGDCAPRPSLVAFAGLTAVGGLGRRVSTGRVARRFGLGYVLRGLGRDRAVVSVVDSGGRTTVGTVDAVLADAVEVTQHPADLARRSANVTGRRVVPIAAMDVVRPAA
jgi:hypothetical protein